MVLFRLAAFEAWFSGSCLNSLYSGAELLRSCYRPSQKYTTTCDFVAKKDADVRFRCSSDHDVRFLRRSSAVQTCAFCDVRLQCRRRRALSATFVAVQTTTCFYGAGGGEAAVASAAAAAASTVGARWGGAKRALLPPWLLTEIQSSEFIRA